jgi:hypothetical protein
MRDYLIAMVIASSAFLVPQKSVGQGISFQVFYSSLSPYGEWVTAGNYGMCWRPVGVPMGWRPYVDGRWIWTEYGWTWASDYEWGWAPFHYGRWTFDPEYGWVWVPGYVWAPAWVEWRWGGGYVGWAPMPPGFHYRVDIVVGPEENDFGVGIAGWNFIRTDEFGRPRYGYIQREEIPRIIECTRNVTRFRFTPNGVYSNGLPREQVERAIHRRIETVNIVRTSDLKHNRVEGNRFLLYSPAPLAPRMRDEGHAIQRQQNPQPPHRTSQGNPQARQPSSRVRSERSSPPAYKPVKPAPDENRPAAQPKPRENNRGRGEESQKKDVDHHRGR